MDKNTVYLACTYCRNLPKADRVTNDVVVMNYRWNYMSLAVFFLLSGGAAHFLTASDKRESLPPRSSLTTFPQTLGAWTQHEAQTLSEAAARELGADDYLSRTYVNKRGAIAFVFMAYYSSQRQRKTYHSPQNCLPGAGWTLGEHRLHSLNNQLNAINEYVIEKDGEEMLAFYWYQGRGRVLANEYWGRWFTLRDAIIRGRTDGALIRVIIPIVQGGNDEQARLEGVAFTKLLEPLLTRYIPD